MTVAEGFALAGGGATILAIMGALWAVAWRMGAQQARIDGHDAKNDEQDERIGAIVIAIAETQKTIGPMVAMLASFQQDFTGFERHYFDSNYPNMLRQMLDGLNRLGSAVEQANILQAVAKAASANIPAQPSHQGHQ